MGVVKNKNNKAKNDVVKKDEKKIGNGKSKKDGKVKKKRTVSCLQCIKKNEKNDDGGAEGKYRVAAPELMQDTFMSDSEDEGGEVECPIQQQQQYRYMNSEAGTLHRAKPLEESVTDGHLWPSNNDSKRSTIDRQPLDIGFLVSFVVDARGGAMKAKRRGGVRIIVPPAACSAPTRVTCRAATRRAPAAAPPPLMEGEALASRLLELQPQGAKFLAPVIIEVPIFTSSCKEREIVILRSDTGETWQDHYLHNNDNPMIQEALQRERQEHGNSGETLGESGERVTRIITCDFPHYLAVVSRVRQEVHIIGPEGGTVSSAHIPQVQALFPPAALTKRIRVGLQAHGASPELCKRILPRHAAVSPVITVEPRRRKFHRSITLSAPLPKEGPGQEKSTSNLRLLCSIMGGQARAVWEDVTGSTPLTVAGDVGSFTTTVSARFWLMNCQNVSDATKLATELYRDMLLVPFEVRIVVLGKRLDALEGRLLVLYITDRYQYDSLLQQEHYTEVAQSTSVRFLDGKQVFLEFSGNLVPVTKCASQPMFTFEAFKDNRVEFTVRVKHHEDTPSGRIYFMNEPKVPRGEQSQSPACVLDVSLPDSIAPRAGKSQLDYLNLDQSGFDALKDELSFHWGDHNHSLPASLPDHINKPVNGHDKIITNGDVKYPTKDTDDADKDTKPQVNGDTLHVDSNKTKATFDSDEDKTPMNTLEKGDKGKKKPEGGSFLGGLAGKVKNVFTHGEDKDEEKESSPKPQPKPRESKEKSPPKPAPRIIEEGLLDKVDDMFKDLKTKPHQKDEEELQNQVYSTKLEVDEDDLKPSKETEEHIYEQYANMQPVETPIYNKVSDPFQYPNNKCCDKRYKHTHDETSNLEDIIEQTKFAAHERLGEVSDKVQNDVKDGLSEIEKEKEGIKQKGSEIKESIGDKVDKVKQDLKDKEQKLESHIQDKLDEANESAHKVQNDIKNKVSDVKSNVSDEVGNFKSSSKAGVDHLVHTASGVTANINDKAHELDFAARERAEQLKEIGHDKFVSFGHSIENATDDFKTQAKGVGNDLKNKAQDGADAVANSIHKAQDNLSHKAQDVKEGVKETAGNIKDATNEKVNDLAESIESAKAKAGKTAADLKSKAEDTKDDVKSEIKKKSKKGKNFFTGLVDNIFGDKDKIEDEVKGKITEGKESANDLLQQASAKKNEIEDDLAKKKSDIKEGAEKLAKEAEAKKDEVENAIHNKTAEVKTAVQDKAHEVRTAVDDKAHDIKSSVENKAEELKSAAQNKAEEVSQAIHDKKQEITNAVQSKKDDISTAIHDKTGEVKESLVEAKDAIHSKKDELEKAVQDKVDDAKNKKAEVLSSVQNKTNEIGQAALDKKQEIANALSHKKDEWESAVNDTTNEAISAVQSKKDEISAGIQEKKEAAIAAVQGKQDEAASELDRIRQEAEHTTEQIKKSAEEALNKGKDSYDDVQRAASDKANDLQKSSKQAFDHVQDATLSTFDKVESSAKDKVNDAKDTWEDLQSSTRDTYADFKDDVYGLESSAQDTLHSFQSSAGNTFDSLDDSAKEIYGGAQNAASNVEASSKELFGDVKSEFEGFQVSADNKLEDVKGEAKERLEEAGERLSEAGQAVSSEADKFTSNLNDLGNSVFGSSGKGFMKDSSAKLLESEKSQSSPSPHKKGSGIPKLKKKNRK